MSEQALVLVDIQNDFLPGGALAVPEGDAVIEVANAMMREFDLVVATQDWHPQDHLSFADNHPGQRVGDVIELDGLQQILWPVHCIQETRGAAFADALDHQRIDRVFWKGMQKRLDSYSGFFDNAHRGETGLGAFLKERGVDAISVMGLATDYCVKFTTLDAVGLGFATRLIVEGCRGVELKAGDVAGALEEMEGAGVVLG